MNPGMTLVELIEAEAKKHKNLARKNIHHSLQLSSSSFAEFSFNQLAKDHLTDNNLVDRHQAFKSTQLSTSSPSSSDSLVNSPQSKYQPRDFGFSYTNDILAANRNSKSLKINQTRLAKEYRHNKNSEAIISYIANNSDATAAAATASRLIFLQIYQFIC